MIIYGDMETIKGEDGKPTVKRTLRFRSDGNILCGTRFRNFPEQIENDVKVFIQEFKNAVLGLYNGDEKAVKKAEKEQKALMEAKAESVVEEEKINTDGIKKEIAKVLKGMDKSDKVKVAGYFQEKLGDVDYRKSDDTEALLKALEFVKTV